MKVWARIRSITNESLIRAACVLGLIALPLMVASVVFPNVWTVLGALSIGQGIGTLSFLLYLIAVARDLEIVRRLRGAATRKSDQA